MNPLTLSLLGGTALLIYSIEELSKAVQYLAGSRFRSWINSFAGNRISALVLGFILSVLTSSSSAVTVMLIGLANSRLLTLEQVFSVTLGASIGTTIIVQLFAFRISEYGLLLTAIGVALGALSRSDRAVRAGRSLFFLGLLFFSMGMVVDAGQKLEENPFFRYTIDYFRDRPLVSLFLATIFTALIHSSAATIGFVMSLMVARQANVSEAIPWILGANLGTTATAYFASFKSGPLGKQAALGNLVTKAAGVFICLPIMPYLAKASEFFGGDISRQIANAHTLFNVALALIFLPFVPWGVRIVRDLAPSKEGEGPFTFQYLDPRSLDTPELALAQAQREVLRLSDIVEQMVERGLGLFQNTHARELETIKGMDQVVDFLNKGIKLYLTKLSQKEMAPEQVQKEFELLLRTNDLENIGDIVDRNLMALVRKTHKRGHAFSKEGWTEITGFHQKVVQCLHLSTAYFTSRDPGLFAKLTVLHQQIEDLTLDLTEQHVQRLHQGVKETLDTTSVHLDIIGNLQRVAGLSVNFTRIHGTKGT